VLWGGWGEILRKKKYKYTTTILVHVPHHAQFTDETSQWCTGSMRGTNQTGELNGIGQALMWLRDVDDGTDAAVVVYDSMYAANMTQEIFEAHCNKEAVEVNIKLLAEVKVVTEVHFVYVKGHSGDEGNDAEDERVQGGKNVSNPMCRLTKACGEGEGWFGPAELVIARMLEQDDSQRGENDGEELGGAAVSGGIEPNAEPAAEGATSPPDDPRG
jgi:ribonuclease HI